MPNLEFVALSVLQKPIFPPADLLLLPLMVRDTDSKYSLWQSEACHNQFARFTFEIGLEASEITPTNKQQFFHHNISINEQIKNMNNKENEQIDLLNFEKK